MKRLPYKQGKYRAAPEDVLYLTGDENGPYSNIHLVYGGVILTCRVLKWYEDKWPTFLRIHKRVLINKAHIISYRADSQMSSRKFVMLSNRTEFEIARRRVPATLHILKALNVPRSIATS